MFEKVSVCPICNGTEFTNVIICQDYLVSQESFVLTDCKSCGFRITNPRPDPESLSKYYESEEYNPHRQSTKGIFSWLYKAARKVNISNKKNIISRFHRSGELLDFGCGTGEFLKEMEESGWKTMGIEPIKGAREYATETHGLKINEKISQLPDNQVFKVITLWHVLEHLPNLNDDLSSLIQHLEKSGNLFIAVPNYDSYDARLYGPFWAGYDVPRHLYHFNPATMKKLLKKHKLILNKIIPLKLDAYYVSILSEKYQNSKTSFLNGLRTGYRSNAEAQQKLNNYSSLIYVASR